MHQIGSRLITLFLCYLFSTSAYAVEKGGYAGAMVGAAGIKFSNDAVFKDSTGISAAAFAGYKILPHLGLEIGLGSLGEFSETRAETEINIDQTYIRAGVSMWGDLSDNWEIYAKLQYSEITSDISEISSGIETKSDFKDDGIYYEIGTLYKITPSLGLITNIAHLSSEINDTAGFNLVHLAIGLQASF